MGIFSSQRNIYCILSCCLLLALFFTACGGNTSSTSATPKQSGGANASATAVEGSLIQKMTIIGSPTAKIVSGTTFEVDGKVKNGDDKQHDIFVKVDLLDASGKQVGSATQNVDNVQGGAIASFAIQSTTQQPTWSKVEANVVKATENINGAGGD